MTRKKAVQWPHMGIAHLLPAPHLPPAWPVAVGTSTGGLLAVALGLKKMSLDECEDIYKVCLCVFGLAGMTVAVGGLLASLVMAVQSAALEANGAVTACHPATGPESGSAISFCWGLITSPMPARWLQVLGRKVFSRVVSSKDSKEESWMEVRWVLRQQAEVAAACGCGRCFCLHT